MVVVGVLWLLLPLLLLQSLLSSLLFLLLLLFAVHMNTVVTHGGCGDGVYTLVFSTKFRKLFHV